MKIKFLQKMREVFASSSKVLSVFSALFVLVTGAKANPVDMATVREAGARFLKANTKLEVRSANDLHLVATYRSGDGVELFHVFNTQKGFVIVAADDCAVPILGYSDEGTFDENNLPIQMQGYLQGFVEQIQYGVENHLVADESIARQWEMVTTTGFLKEERGTTAVQPLLTDIWDQNCYYNSKCPEDANGPCGHVYAGCVATSCAQIMHYWGYPATGIGSHSYTPTGYPQQTANFGATVYDWSNMPNSLTSASDQTQMDAVATLIWHCGVAVNMGYGPNGSSASSSNLPSILVNHFNYSSDLSMVYRNSYSSEDWLTMMKDCLDLGRPIHYRGTDEGDGGGHAFVCDGYDANDFLHFNWGWGGYGNNYFADGALNPPNGYAFNISNAAIINIHPDCDQGASYQVTATGNPTYGGIVTGSGDYNCGSGCTLTALPYSEYTFCSWMEDGVVVSTDPTYSFTVMGDRNLVANFVQTGGNDCTLVFTLNDSYGDGWNGNALTVSYSTGCLVNERLTIANGGSAIFTRNVVDGSHIILSWVMGSWTSQCSFTVSYENGTVIYQSANLSSGLFYEFDVDCEGNTPPKPLSNVVVEYYPDTNDPFGQYVKVSWDGPINETVYQIYRSKCNGLGEELIADNVTGNEYIDYGWDSLAYGNYMYGVSAVDDRGIAGEINWNATTTVADAAFLEPLDLDMMLEFQPLVEPVNAGMDREAWLSYDNGTHKTSIGSSTASSRTWGCMYPASMLEGNNVLSKISIYENSNMTNDITVEIYSGGTDAPVTLVGTQTVTPVGNGFHVVTLSEPVAIDPSKNLWIVLTTNGTYIIPACENTVPDNQWIRSGGNWRHIGDIAPTMSGYGWMIRGYVEKIVPIVWSNCISKAVPPSPQVLSVEAEYYPEASNPYSPYVKVFWTTDTDEVCCQIYRALCDGSESTLIASDVTGNEYIDYGWTDLDDGNYMYGVVIVDANGRASDMTWMEPDASARPLTREVAEAQGMDVCWTQNGAASNASSGSRGTWDLLATFEGNSGGQQAVASDGSFIYTASWQSVPTGGYTFYKYDLSGNFIEGFNIAGATGIRDLSYDGQYFYGSSGGANIFKMDFANRVLVGTIACTGATSRHCTYDPNNNGLWVGNWSTLAFYDMSGNLVMNAPAPQGAYGSAYFMDDSGEEHLYLFCQPASDAKVFDYNITTNTMDTTAIFDFAETPGFNATVAGGCFIGDYNGTTAFFGNVQQSPNLIGIYDLVPEREVWSNCIEKETPSEYYDIAVTANPTEGGTVSGGGSYLSGTSCSLTATANEGYSFANWTKDGEVVSTEAAYSFTVTEDAAFVANFAEESSETTQTTAFNQGWTWWSTYIEQSGISGLTMLENELGTNGLTIKSQSQFVNYNPNTNKWTGSLKSINNEGAFMIRVGTACEVNLTGAPVNPADHPITLNPGWTWIGYPVSEAMSVADAFANITPSVGDQVKSQSGFATYNGTKWSGSLKNMEPGKGYMYKSNSTETVILVYPDGAGE